MVTGVAVAALSGLAAVTTSAPGGRHPSSFLGVAPPEASAAAAVEPPTVRVAAVGDVILGSTPKLPPHGGRTFFDDVRRELSGDVVTGNLESPLTDRTYSAKCAASLDAPRGTGPDRTGSGDRARTGAADRDGAGTGDRAGTGTGTRSGSADRSGATGRIGDTGRVGDTGPVGAAGREQGSAPARTAGAAKGCYAFRVPPGYARWIAGAGFTVMNVANNHARDYGNGGLSDTVAALRRYGVDHTGPAGRITRTSVGGVRVAMLGFSPYSWTNSVLDVPAAARLVRRAAASADVVVVQMHVGAEGADRAHVRKGPESFLGEQRGDPIRFAHAVVDAGADLVVGHSPHVLRGMEFYRGRLIAYSLGNFAGYRTLSTVGPLGVGGVLRVTLRKDGTWAEGALVGTRLVDGGLPGRDPQRQALTLVRRLSAADFGRTAVRVGATGALTPP